MTNHQQAVHAKNWSTLFLVLTIAGVAVMCGLVAHGYNVASLFAAIVTFVTYKHWETTAMEANYYASLHPSQMSVE